MALKVSCGAVAGVVIWGAAESPESSPSSWARAMGEVNKNITNIKPK
jgi:hypothetical protein